MKAKSPMLKALIGNQGNLNAGLRSAIEAAPTKMKKESMAKMKKAPAKMKKESMAKVKNKVSKEQIKTQSDHAAKVKKKTGRSFSKRYVSGDYSGEGGERARKLDVEIANEYDGTPRVKEDSSMKMMDKKSPTKKSVRQQQIEGTYVEKKDRPKKVVVKKPKGVSVRKQQILDAEKKRLSNRKGDNKYKENVEKVLKSQNRTLTPKKEKEKQVKVDKVKIKKIDTENNSKIKTPTKTPPKSKDDIKKEKRLARNERQKARVKDLKYRLLGKAGRAKMVAKGYVPKSKKK